MTELRSANRGILGTPLRVGVDIGGSKVAVLVADPSGAVVGRELAPSVPADPDLAIAQIAAVIRSAVAAAGATMADVGAVGVGVPGRVDRATGTVTFAVNLGWQHLPLGERLATTLGVPVTVENDVRTAAAGLHRRAPFGPVDDLAYLSIGTGISAGVVLGGRVHRGVRGVAGEIGHVVLEPGGPRCACGLDGCFEALASGSAIARAARDAIAAGEPTTLAAFSEPTAEDVFAAASTGDSTAAAIVDRATTWTARMVHALVLAYDVRLVAIGGGVSKADGPFIDRIRTALDAICVGSPFARELLSETEVALLSPDLEIGPWGAIALIDDGSSGVDRGRRPGEEVVAREPVI
jgi:predicted NBD/HSP70 family sugar kinase